MPIDKQKFKEEIKQLDEILANNYLDADHFYKNKLQSIFNEEDFIKYKAKYVKNWFKKNYPNTFTPDEYQCLAIADWNQNTLLTARAGSGKTSTMVNKAVFLIKHCGITPNSILILAFNRNASFTLKERLFKLLADNNSIQFYNSISNQSTPNNQDDYDKNLTYAIKYCRINIPIVLTFHSLAYRLAKPLGNFNIGENSLNYQILNRVIYDLCHSNDNQSFIIKFLYLGCTHFGIEYSGYYTKTPFRSLDGKELATAQDLHVANYLFSRGINYRYNVPKAINELGFFTIQNGTKKISIKATDKPTLKLLKIKASDDCIELTNISKKLSDPLPKDQENILNEALAKLFNQVPEKLSLLQLFERSTYALNRFLDLSEQFIVLALNHDITPEQTIDMLIAHEKEIQKKKGSQDKEVLSFEYLISKVFPLYEFYKKQLGQLDFLSIFPEAIKNIKTDSSRSFAKSLSLIIVDEYQDFSTLYYNLLITLLQQNSQIHLCCVGDDWQAINNYSGSEIKFFEQFEKYFNPATKLYLPSNYRSYSKIVNFTNLLRQGKGIPAKTIHKEKGSVININTEELDIPNINQEIKNLATALLLKYPNETVAILNRTQNQVSMFSPMMKHFSNLIVSTIHGYKGLEADSVIIDVTSNHFENVHPDSAFFYGIGITQDKIMQEEARLIYVGLTRARKKIFIIHPGTEKQCSFTIIPDNLKFTHDRYDPANTMDLLAEFYQELKEQITVTIEIEYHLREEIKQFGYSYIPNDHSWFKVFKNITEFRDELCLYSWYPIKPLSGNRIIIKNYRNKIIKVE